MTNIFKKTLLVGLAAASLATGLAASTAPASAFPMMHHHRGWGGPLAVGVIGGLALGAIAASRADDCYLARRAVYNEDGDFLGYRAVRVCD
ncbi:hypothetical protein [Methylovirgula sp. 4M-Z18]|uniref:hypothetical protein n=1 Tax=Methylovirgula sp. 4M-Z18 TaxID=2293567 RepID=UPI000E2EC597|nr:hypothetical protein [Methylovirgula sp. 4M-Z18]RFB79599.1 hypothetical protein DYH55_08890 [Methylovirgula sp. 4M-Z18]